jgi:hypothetical protein
MQQQLYLSIHKRKLKDASPSSSTRHQAAIAGRRPPDGISKCCGPNTRATWIRYASADQAPPTVSCHRNTTTPPSISRQISWRTCSNHCLPAHWFRTLRRVFFLAAKAVRIQWMPLPSEVISRRCRRRLCERDHRSQVPALILVVVAPRRVTAWEAGREGRRAKALFSWCKVNFFNGSTLICIW